MALLVHLLFSADDYQLEILFALVILASDNDTFAFCICTVGIGHAIAAGRADYPLLHLDIAHVPSISLEMSPPFISASWMASTFSCTDFDFGRAYMRFMSM